VLRLHVLIKKSARVANSDAKMAGANLKDDYRSAVPHAVERAAELSTQPNFKASILD
jgi:hypothetical protein